ncbi:hypothetical protein RB195_016938 [Necator americanus]|uniref:Serpentine receptor class gamma n=1 Tax=Necator americanus TaxID=51031 RepID=A0ABR1C3W6_NECAM
MTIRIIYCIPSVVLYALVLIALYKEVKGSKGHFNHLLMTQAVLNIAVFLNSFYAVQLANVTEVKDWWSVLYTRAPVIVTSICECLVFHFAYVQTYMTFFISLFRTTIIALPTKHKTIWSYAFPTSVVITLVTPFFSTYQFLIFRNWFENDYDFKYFILRTEAGLYVVMTQLLVFMCLLLVLMCSVNAISVVFLFLRPLNNQNRAERNMFILALLDFFIEAGFVALYVIIYTNSAGSPAAQSLIPYASDILTFSNAYLLLLLNKRIRKRVLELLRCSRCAIIFCPQKTSSTFSQIYYETSAE